MSARGFVQRHRAVRWVAPIGIAAAAALAASGVLSAHATSQRLPRTNPASLLAGLQTTHVDGLSGTVVSHLSLGLPQLPVIGAGSGDGSSPVSLLTGSHTMQVWYGGPTKQRLALLGATDETDLFRDGRQLWEWNSMRRTAVHTVLPARAAAAPTSPPLGASPSASSPTASSVASLTPEQLARRALDALDPSTKVQVRKNDSVADRPAYDLVLTPRSHTRIGSVHIAVDGQTKLPLAVQVYARGATKPAVDVAYTSITYGMPSQRNFTFAPPPDAHVRTFHPKHALGGHRVSRAHQGARGPAGVHVIGSGWTRVLAAELPAASVRRIERSAAAQALTPVSGTWGRGRLLDSSLVTVLVTDDGRVFAGAVDPDVLYAAAGTR